MSHTIKGLPESAVKHDGSALRVAIVHARWNTAVIDALVAGAVAKLKERGVKDSNIVVQSVPGSFELPLACQRVIAGAHVQAGSNVTDLLGGLSLEAQAGARVQGRRRQRGCSTRGVPVIFGVLTALTDEQALDRAGLTPTGHNHGEDWGLAAVEMGAHVRKWRKGRFT
ncbi:6,7-dimethyl-8-ribityllumazine synthase [Mycena olivaceomarginata]|nr:6,7-dimethyl-8-ribityllumazine synthase [Mycena olivaceomarginata]